jgi:hypothetical protein
VKPPLSWGNQCIWGQLQRWKRCTRWRSLLKHCATSWKVANSIPDGVIEIFYWLNRSGRIANLRSTQVYVMRIKLAGEYGWKSCRINVSVFYKFWEPQLSEAPRACQVPYGDSVCWDGATYRRKGTHGFGVHTELGSPTVLCTNRIRGDEWAERHLLNWITPTELGDT